MRKKRRKNIRELISEQAQMSQSTKLKLPQLIAHRGGGLLAPENTIEAIDCGRFYGFNAVEFDVMLSQNSVAILMHDETISRTVTGSNLICGTRVCDIPSDVLLGLDAGSWFGAEFSKVKIPLFESVIKHCIANNVWMNVEIKPCEGFEVETGKIVSTLLSQYFPPGSINLPLISSFSYDSLVQAHLYARHIPRGYLLETVSECPTWKNDLRNIDAASLNVNYKYLTADVIKEAKEEGYSVFCYTVNDEETANKLIDMGVDSFCTDRIDIFSKWTKI